MRGEQRFVIEQDGAVPDLVYRTEPGRLILVHTEVPDALGGRDVGGRSGSAVHGGATRSRFEHSSSTIAARNAS